MVFLMMHCSIENRNGTILGMRYLESKNCIHRDLGNYTMRLNGVKIIHIER